MFRLWRFWTGEANMFLDAIHMHVFRKMEPEHARLHRIGICIQLLKGLKSGDVWYVPYCRYDTRSMR